MPKKIQKSLFRRQKNVETLFRPQRKCGKFIQTLKNTNTSFRYQGKFEKVYLDVKEKAKRFIQTSRKYENIIQTRKKIRKRLFRRQRKCENVIQTPKEKKCKVYTDVKEDYSVIRNAECLFKRHYSGGNESAERFFGCQ